MKERIKNLIVFGTRPEAIKMAPLIKEFEKHSEFFDTKVCVTGQHRQMLDQVLEFFEIEPEFDLDLMRHNQTLFDISADILLKIKQVFDEFCPDYVFVHGDTTTSTIISLAAFYSKIKVCHVEAGLRTYNKYSPFPEEMNRQLTGRLADFHFSPTDLAKANLLREGVDPLQVIVTGNTVVDALFDGLERNKELNNPEIDALRPLFSKQKKTILITGHRRENLGEGFMNICFAVKQIAETNEVNIVYPVHMNPNVRDTVFSILENIPNVHLIPPQPYPVFLWMMEKSDIILTDSGGIQEEAPSLGKPVLVMREVTERPEALSAGTIVLVGTDKEKIIQNVQALIDDKEYYASFMNRLNPYGDGEASKRIVGFFLKKEFNQNIEQKSA
ncbi:UDP-N-acetylglucosamine 2-epimerase (non-hydrolyzing) [Chitinophaga sp.]|uniref:non-hydrolyzing UDP-N-acetylglucosamine 2-epimerase n=1 Tax=Chitinophaga sp. TaxID=1869181 RepID=UPI0031DBB4D1